MCQKQCRDENGFKCHLSSEGHKRQMEIFGQNPERIVEGWVGTLLQLVSTTSLCLLSPARPVAAALPAQHSCAQPGALPVP